MNMTIPQDWEKEFDEKFVKDNEDEYWNVTENDYTLKSFITSLLHSERERVVKIIKDVMDRKETVNGYQPHGMMEGDQEPMQKKIFFDGFKDGRNLMKIDLLSAIALIENKQNPTK